MNEEDFNQAPFGDFAKPNPIEDLMFRMAEQRRQREQDPLNQIQQSLGPTRPQGSGDDVMAFIEQMLQNQR